jgi:hypothetical protein
MKLKKANSLINRGTEFPEHTKILKFPALKDLPSK